MDFNYWYGKFTKETYGNTNIATLFEALEERIKRLKEMDKEFTISFQKFDEEQEVPFICVIVTPLMKRVHKLVRYFF